jgi:hypothetical protein
MNKKVIRKSVGENPELVNEPVKDSEPVKAPEPVKVSAKDQLLKIRNDVSADAYKSAEMIMKFASYEFDSVELDSDKNILLRCGDNVKIVPSGE